jgi:hypothetical protein
MKIKISPFILLCIMGGLAIFSSTMAKNPALPLFIRSMGVPVSTLGFIAAASACPRAFSPTSSGAAA